MKFFVYRFLDINENVIYVGKTNSMKKRMGQHFGKKGHLPKECYESTTYVEYITLSSKIDMDIIELYYINKWKPFFNRKDKQQDNLEVKVNESTYIWEKYELKHKQEPVKVVSYSQYLELVELLEESREIQEDTTKILKETIDYYDAYIHRLQSSFNKAIDELIPKYNKIISELITKDDKIINELISELHKQARGIAS